MNYDVISKKCRTYPTWWNSNVLEERKFNYSCIMTRPEITKCTYLSHANRCLSSLLIYMHCHDYFINIKCRKNERDAEIEIQSLRPVPVCYLFCSELCLATFVRVEPNDGEQQSAFVHMLAHQHHIPHCILGSRVGGNLQQPTDTPLGRR